MVTHKSIWLTIYIWMVVAKFSASEYSNSLEGKARLSSHSKTQSADDWRYLGGGPRGLMATGLGPKIPNGNWFGTKIFNGNWFESFSFNGKWQLVWSIFPYLKVNGKWFSF